VDAAASARAVPSAAAPQAATVSYIIGPHIARGAAQAAIAMGLGMTPVGAAAVAARTSDGGAALLAAARSERPSRDRGAVAWDARLARLSAYKRKHGDCNVPCDWAKDTQLANWVGDQRECKRALDRGEPRPAGMTEALEAELDALGFEWELLPTAAVGGQRSCAEMEPANPGQAGSFEIGLDGVCGEGQREAGLGGRPTAREKWTERQFEAQLAKLREYKAAHGDCNVPQGWAADPRLGGWVSTQRKRKKALDRGDPNPCIRPARVAKLDALGFAWEPGPAVRARGRPDDAGWEAQLAKLTTYKQEHGNCNVPRGWDDDVRLANWVNDQRRFKRALDRGEDHPHVTAARVAKLDALGFNWTRRQGPRSDRTSSDCTSPDRTSPDRTSPDRKSLDHTSPDRDVSLYAALVWGALSREDAHEVGCVKLAMVAMSPFSCAPVYSIGGYHRRQTGWHGNEFAAHGRYIYGTPIVDDAEYSQ
jgi:hypothetical protein